MTLSEKVARAAGWEPVADWHVMFKDGAGVARPLKDGETYGEGDSYMSRPLRHATSFEAAVIADNLELGNTIELARAQYVADCERDDD